MANQDEKLINEALDLVRQDRAESSQETRRSLSEFAALSPGHQAAVDDARRFFALAGSLQRPLATRRRRFTYHFQLYLARLTEPSTPMVAACVILVASVVSVYWLSSNLSSSHPPRVATEPMESSKTFATDHSEQRKVALEDGSIVWLGWRTRMEVRFTGSERTVRLHRGVAAFDIRPDVSRPFLVESGQVTTQVTGTEFVVNRQRDQEVHVAVLEGKVNVIDTRGKRSELSAAQMIKVRHGIAGPVQARLINEMGRWREGVIAFESRPLLDALATLEPYTRYELDTDNIAGHDGTVTGMFFVDEAELGLLSILATHRIEFAQSGSLLTLRNPAN